MEQGPTYSSILLLNEPPLKCSGLKQQLFTSYESIDWLYRSVLCGISWACSRLETCAETFKMSHSHVHSWALWDTGMVRLIICLPACPCPPAHLPAYLPIYLPTYLLTYLPDLCLSLSFLLFPCSLRASPSQCCHSMWFLQQGSQTSYVAGQGFPKHENESWQSIKISP